MILPSETESKFYFAASTRENTHDQQTGKHNICRGDHFRFGSVFTHKKQPNRKKKKQTRNRTETGPNRPVSVWFRFGFGSVFDAQNRKNLYAFFLGFVMGFMMGF